MMTMLFVFFLNFFDLSDKVLYFGTPIQNILYFQATEPINVLEEFILDKINCVEEFIKKEADEIVCIFNDTIKQKIILGFKVYKPPGL